ncbi:MAG TPA: DASS family sodium-coupled anion symporter [Pyrinomonadaceae bacterium]|nr:DASS family sodium-coupled anion symporter [Pyrinomonadaceae bacterium]
MSSNTQTATQTPRPGGSSSESRPFALHARRASVIVIIAGLAALSLVWIKDPLIARAVVVAGVCLTLWLSEAVPPFVPTLVLWLMTPLLLQPLSEEFRLGRVLGWSAEPVLVLFLGGFALGVAARRHGIDARLAQIALRLSGGRRLALLALTAAATAFLSMWMSNIAAAAMMLSAAHPLLAGMPEGDRFRRALLLSIAVGANFGGIATPIGTGPNAIAIAAATRHQTITFLDWMAFALPLSLGLIVAGVLLLALRFRVRGVTALPDLPQRPRSRGASGVLIVFIVTVAAWLTEPLHGASSALVALAATAVLFGSGLLERRDLSRLDWSTLMLIAGGIGLGNLLEKSGVVTAVAAAVPWAHVPDLARVFLLCFASATLSALMSNTATATMLIPLAASLDPAPSTAILIAVAASLGVPFVISTPPNAMVYGEGGVRSGDFLAPGLALMLLGCLLISLTGPFVLNLLGIP